MSYNIQGGNFKDDPSHCDKIAQVIYESKVDIIALNEVANSWYIGSGAFQSINEPQWSKIADRVAVLNGGNPGDWARAYYQTMTKNVLYGIGYGNAIISRWAFDNIKTIELSHEGDSDNEIRKASFVYVKGAPTPFIFVCTHFLHVQGEIPNRTRAANITAITNEINSLKSSYPNAPVILAGDMNTWYDGTIGGPAGTANTPNTTALAQLRYLDWTITNDFNPTGTWGGTPFDIIAFYKNAGGSSGTGGLKILKHYVIPETYSDHDPAVTILLPEGDSPEVVPAPLAQNVPESSNVSNVTLSMGDGLPWLLTSDSTWCTPRSVSGTGSATVSFDIGRNTTGAERTATIRVLVEGVENSEKTFTITQVASSTVSAIENADYGNAGTKNFGDFSSSASSGGYGLYNGFSFITGNFSSKNSNWGNSAFLTDLSCAYAWNQYNAAGKAVYLNVYTSPSPSESSFVGQSTNRLSSFYNCGEVVASDYHTGYSGNAKSNHTYSLNVPAGTYTLRYWAEVKTEVLNSSGNINSAGTAILSTKPTSWTPTSWVEPKEAPAEILALKTIDRTEEFAISELRVFETEVTVTTAGTFNATFVYTSGSQRINLMGADLIKKTSNQNAGRFYNFVFDNLELNENIKYYAFFSTEKSTKANYAFTAEQARLRLGKTSDGLSGDDSVYTNTSGATVSGWLPIYKTSWTSVDAEPFLQLRKQGSSETSVSSQIAADNTDSNPIAVYTNVPPWSVTSNTSWLSVTPASGGTETFSILYFSANSENQSTTAARTGTFTVSAGEKQVVYSVTQAAAPLKLALGLSEWEILENSSDTKTVEITTNASWTATSNSGWLILSKTAGSRNASIILTATENTSSEARTAIVTVSVDGMERMITITQPAVPTLTISENSWSLLKSAGTKNITVTTNRNLWTLDTGNADWLTTARENNGDGTYKLTLTAVANPTDAERTGTVTIFAGTLSETITVTQSQYTVLASPAEFNFSAAGGTGTINYTAAGQWLVESNSGWCVVNTDDLAVFFQVAFGGQAGTGSVYFSVSPNESTSPRIGKIKLGPGGKDAFYVTINQAGRELSSYESWSTVENRFPDGTLEADKLPDVAPAGDGIVNLEKFVFDVDGTLDPTKSAGAFGTAGIVSDAGVDFLQVEFPYNPAAEAVSLSVERFAGTEWLTGGADIVRDSTDKKIRVKLTTPISAETPKQAVRLTGTLYGKTFTTEPYGYELISVPAKTTTKFGLRVHKPFIFQKEIPAATGTLPFVVDADEVTISDADLPAKIDIAKSYIVEILTAGESAGTRVSTPFIVNRSAWHGFGNTTKTTGTVTFDCANLADYLTVPANVAAIVGYRIREASTLSDVFGSAAESGLKTGTSRTADMVKYHILDKNLWSFWVNSRNVFDAGSLNGVGVNPAATPIFYHRPIQLQRRENDVLSFILTGEVLTEAQEIHVYKSDGNVVSGLLFGGNEAIEKPAEETTVEISSEL